MEEIIKLDQITKRYRGAAVLDRLSLSVIEGQSAAFVGRNGCGKSTLLKVLAGLVRPDSGTVVLKRKLLFEYVPERFPQMSLTAVQYLSCMGRIEGLAASDIKEKCGRLFEDFFFTGLSGVPMKHLSKGSLQKVGVMQALLRRPDVLLLDEPLSGQDEESQKVLIQKVNGLRNAGTTVLMSCHERLLIDSFADRIYRIEGGAVSEQRIAEETRVRGSQSVEETKEGKENI